MYYHASPVGGIQRLEPRISNHGLPLVYFSAKRENVLVYCSNAVEKYCKETGYLHHGKWTKWGTYGFTRDGILRLEEYYPGATLDTYKGVSAYIYSTKQLPCGQALEGIPFAYTSAHAVQVSHCEYIEDAYNAIMEEVRQGHILLEKYEAMSERKLAWIRETVQKEYQDPSSTDEYRHFLKGKFPFIRTESPVSG